MDFQVSEKTASNGEVTIEVTVRGRGAHKFAVRSENVSFPQAERVVNLPSDGSIRWQGQMISRDMPWVAVVVPDGDLSQRQEALGRPVERP